MGLIKYLHYIKKGTGQANKLGLLEKNNNRTKSNIVNVNKMKKLCLIMFTLILYMQKILTYT